MLIILEQGGGSQTSGSEKANRGLWAGKEQGQIWGTNPLFSINQH